MLRTTPAAITRSQPSQLCYREAKRTHARGRACVALVYIYLHASDRASTAFVCVYIYTFTYYIYNIYTYIYTNIYICVCIYIYICKCLRQSLSRVGSYHNFAVSIPVFLSAFTNPKP